MLGDVEGTVVITALFVEGLAASEVARAMQGEPPRDAHLHRWKVAVMPSKCGVHPPDIAS